MKYGSITVTEVLNSEFCMGVCECGTVKRFKIKRLRCGRIKSCGCKQFDWFKNQVPVWLNTHYRFYRCWRCMMARCFRPKTTNYYRYGGRGITVCERWRAFQNFAEDMFPTWREGLTIERNDNDGDYEPSNCRWASMQEQCNNRCSNIRIEFDGRSLTQAEWARVAGIPKATFWARLKKGWTMSRALTEPLRIRPRKPVLP